MRFQSWIACVLSVGVVALGSSRLVAQESAAPVARVVTGALLSGTAGTLVGGVAGLYIGGSRCLDPGVGETCHGFDGMLVGGAIGLTVGTPVGAHLMNHRRGPLAYSLLASVALAAAGAVALRHADQHMRGSQRNSVIYGVLISVPVLQVATSTLIETRARRR